MRGKKFTIYRGNWRRGGDSEGLCGRFGTTSLLNDEGFMCCLGQCAMQLGISREFILGMAEPLDIDNCRLRLADGVLVAEAEEDYPILRHTKLTRDAMYINDNEKISDAERESQLIYLFS